MKIKILLMMWGILFFMASCDKNDEPKPQPNPAQEIAGVYNGKIEMSVGGNSYDPMENIKVTIKNQEDGKAEITLAGFGEGNMAFKDMVMKDVEVKAQTNGGYSLSGNINTMSGTTNVTGSLTGTIGKDGDANITFTLKPGAMPFSVTAVFTGK